MSPVVVPPPPPPATAGTSSTSTPLTSTPLITTPLATASQQQSSAATLSSSTARSTSAATHSSTNTVTNPTLGISSAATETSSSLSSAPPADTTLLTASQQQSTATTAAATPIAPTFDPATNASASAPFNLTSTAGTIFVPTPSLGANTFTTRASTFSSIGSSAGANTTPFIPQGNSTAMMPAFNSTIGRINGTDDHPTGGPATQDGGGNIADTIKKPEIAGPSAAGTALLLFVAWKGSRRFRNFTRTAAAATANLGIRAVNVARTALGMESYDLIEPYQSPPPSPERRPNSAASDTRLTEMREEGTYDAALEYGDDEDLYETALAYGNPFEAARTILGLSDEMMAANLGITLEQFNAEKDRLSRPQLIQALGVTEAEYAGYEAKYSQPQYAAAASETLYASGEDYEQYAVPYAAGAATEDTFGFEDARGNGYLVPVPVAGAAEYYAASQYAMASQGSIRSGGAKTKRPAMTLPGTHGGEFSDSHYLLGSAGGLAGESADHDSKRTKVKNPIYDNSEDMDTDNPSPRTSIKGRGEEKASKFTGHNGSQHHA